MLQMITERHAFLSRFCWRHVAACVTLRDMTAGEVHVRRIDVGWCKRGEWSSSRWKLQSCSLAIHVHVSCDAAALNSTTITVISPVILIFLARLSPSLALLYVSMHGNAFSPLLFLHVCSQASVYEVLIRKKGRGSSDSASVTC